MKNFGKLIFGTALAVSMVSCLGEATYSSSYRSDMSFENNWEKETDSLFFQKEPGTGFGCGELAYFHKLTEDKSAFEGGFIVSRLKAESGLDNDRFRVNYREVTDEKKAPANDKYAPYLVYYMNPDVTMPQYDMEFMYAQLTSGTYTCTPVACLVNNTEEVVNAVKANFADGDLLSLKMTGYLDGQVTGSNEIVLAEYYMNKPDSLMQHWTVMKLDKLGQIDHIKIEMTSTKPEVPKAFCLDNMIADISISY